MWLQQLSTLPNRFPCFLLGCQFQFPNFTLVWILYHWFVTYHHHHHHNLWHLFKVEPNVFQTQFPFSILLWTFFVCFSAHLPVPYISSHLLCELTNFFLIYWIIRFSIHDVGAMLSLSSTLYSALKIMKQTFFVEYTKLNYTPHCPGQRPAWLSAVLKHGYFFACSPSLKNHWVSWIKRLFV